MAELVDAPDLGSGFARSEGSSPFIRIFERLYTVISASLLVVHLRTLSGDRLCHLLLRESRG